MPRPQATLVHRLDAAFRDAVAAMLAAVLAMGIAQPIAPGAGSAVLAVVLSLSLWRSHLERDRRGRIEAALLLPCIGLAALGVGMLLRQAPWAGAALFVAGLFVSIWLRRFGPMAARAGRLVALPFVVLLVAPRLHGSAHGALPPALVPVVVAFVALACVTVCHAVALRSGWLRGEPVRKAMPAPPHAPRRAGGMRPIASTRMALQMATALAAAFAAGYAWFPQRWSWIVLTAFIVVSGNSGRVDVVHKALLRVAGAAAGTLVAFVLAAHHGGDGAQVVVPILLAVFLGTWLRPLNYAWWALFATIALALLQGHGATTDAAPALHAMWGLRLEEIAIGAAIGIAACWTVFPVPSESVLRRRIADALAAASQALAPSAPGHGADGFEAQMHHVRRMAPALRLARFATRGRRPWQAADWIDALDACHAPLLALIATGNAPAAVRRALGNARKAMADPAHVQPALLALRDALLAETPVAGGTSQAGDATTARPGT